MKNKPLNPNMTIGLQKPLSRRCFQSTLSLNWGHAVAQLVEALCCKPEGTVSIPDGNFEIFR
jgi:hypothetical protein